MPWPWDDSPQVPANANAAGFDHELLNPLAKRRLVAPYLPGPDELLAEKKRQEDEESGGLLMTLLGLPEKALFGQAIKGGVRGYGEGGASGAVEGFLRGTPFAFLWDWVNDAWGGENVSRTTSFADVRRAFGDKEAEGGWGNAAINLLGEIALSPIELFAAPLALTKAGAAAGKAVASAETLAKSLELGHRAGIVFKIPFSAVAMETNLGFKSGFVLGAKLLDGLGSVARQSRLVSGVAKVFEATYNLPTLDTAKRVKEAAEAGVVAKRRFLSAATLQFQRLSPEAREMAERGGYGEFITTMSEVGADRVDYFGTVQATIDAIRDSDVTLRIARRDALLRHNEDLSKLWDKASAADTDAINLLYTKYAKLPLPAQMLEAAGLSPRVGVELSDVNARATGEGIADALMTAPRNAVEGGPYRVGAGRDARKREIPVGGITEGQAQRADIGTEVNDAVQGARVAAREKVVNQYLKLVEDINSGKVSKKALDEWLGFHKEMMTKLGMADMQNGFLNESLEPFFGLYAPHIVSENAMKAIQERILSVFKKYDYSAQRDFKDMLAVEANMVIRDFGSKATGFIPGKEFAKKGEVGVWQRIFDQDFIKQIRQIDPNGAEMLNAFHDEDTFFKIAPVENLFKRAGLSAERAGIRAVQGAAFNAKSPLVHEVVKAKDFLGKVDQYLAPDSEFVAVVDSKSGARALTRGEAVVEYGLKPEQEAAFEIAQHQAHENFATQVQANAINVENALADLQMSRALDETSAEEMLVSKEGDLLATDRMRGAVRSAKEAKAEADAAREVLAYHNRAKGRRLNATENMFAAQQHRALRSEWEAAINAEARGIPVSEYGRFHGTSSEIASLQEYTYSTQNIYGQGFYTTDDVSVASSYGKKGLKLKSEQKNGFIYKVSENRPVKFVDLDSTEAKDALRVVRDFVDSGRSSESLASALDEVEQSGAVSLGKIFDEARAYSRSLGESSDSVQEDLDSIIESLKKLGYGGFSHTGGRLTGGKSHAVKIYWNPSQDISIAKFDPASSSGAAKQATNLPVEADFDAFVKSRWKLAKQGYAAAQAEVEVRRAAINDLLRGMRESAGYLDEGYKAQRKIVVQQGQRTRANIFGASVETKDLLAELKARRLDPNRIAAEWATQRKVAADGYLAVDEAKTMFVGTGRDGKPQSLFDKVFGRMDGNTDIKIVKRDVWQGYRAFMDDLRKPDPWRQTSIGRVLDKTKEAWAANALYGVGFFATRVRNIGQNMIAQMQSGLFSMSAQRQAAKMQRALGKGIRGDWTEFEKVGAELVHGTKMTLREAFDAGMENGAVHFAPAFAGEVGGVAQRLQGTVEGAAKETANYFRTNPGRAILDTLVPPVFAKAPSTSPAFKFQQTLESTADQWQRFAAYLGALKKDIAPDAAGQQVRKWLYDSTLPLTFTERSLFRRVIPFYSFQKYALRTTMQLALERPAAITTLGKIRETVNANQGPQGDGKKNFDVLLPPFVTEQFGIVTDNTPTGPKVRLFGSWFNVGEAAAVADAFDRSAQDTGDGKGSSPFVRYVMNRMHPFLRAGIEQVVGRDFYSDRPLEDFEGQQVEFMGMVIDKRTRRLMQNLRFLNELDKLGVFNSGEFKAVVKGVNEENAAQASPGLALLEKVAGSAFSVVPFPGARQINVEQESSYRQAKDEEALRRVKGLMLRRVAQPNSVPTREAELRTLGNEYRETAARVLRRANATGEYDTVKTKADAAQLRRLRLQKLAGTGQARAEQ